VAIFTTQDSRDHRYWLAKVVQPLNSALLAPVLNAKATCPVSKEEFNEGDRVVYLTYLDRQRGNRVFRHRPELGVFTVPATMLRCDGIILDELGERVYNQPLYEISFELDAEIKNIIEHKCKDREV
jgi:hypothetical protein